MKKLLFALLLIASLAEAQKPAAAKSAPKSQANAAAGIVTLTCKFLNYPPAGDSLSLYEPGGLVLRTLARAGRSLQDSSTFIFKIPMGEPRFYAVGITEAAVAKLILGQEKEVTLFGNAQYLERSRTTNSPANRAYEQVQRRAQQFLEESAAARQALADAQRANSNTAKIAAQERFLKLGKTKTRYLDSLKTANQTLWRVATVLVQPEYQAENDKGYNAEYEFLGNEYFRYADLKDKAYESIPDVFNAFENYARMFGQFGAQDEQAKKLINALLAKLPADAKISRMALGGIVSGLKASNSTLYPTYAAQYVNLYRSTSHNGDVARLEYDLKKNSTFTAGMEAPDLAGPTPEGDQYALSKMRGKYVLVDFWASWCGPCRREMPNVKAVYEKYKSKGFDVLGVSLDREAGAWKKAIETDGLPWHHISDLKGWNSEYAQLYSVTSIPQTLLVDKEGKIIVRNLRGEQLEGKLKEIFGE